jgi:hypothetical protein
MQHCFPVLFENVPEGTLKGEKLFDSENIQFIVEGILVNRFAIVTIRVLQL